MARGVEAGKKGPEYPEPEQREWPMVVGKGSSVPQRQPSLNRQERLLSCRLEGWWYWPGLSVSDGQ